MFLTASLQLPAATNDLTSRLQQGLFDEEASRDLNAAIADYQALAAQFDQDRQIAATAIYRLGECYRKLGQTNDAVTQYQRLIREFADQKDLVTLSRQNLTGLGVDAQPNFAQRLQAVVNGVPPEAKAAAPTTDEESQEIIRIQQMIQDSPDLINAPGGENRLTPLSRAAANGWLKVAAYLLDHGADVNSGGYAGATALYEAAGAGNRAMVELLLSRGAGVNPQSPNIAGAEPTPLAIAVRRGFPAVVETLLDAKADVNAADSDGDTALHEAVDRGNDKITRLLLAAGANPNAKNQNGSTPLMYAPASASVDILKQLLAAGADPNLTNNSGRTTLSYAAKSGSLPKLQLLLAAKADPNGGPLDLPLMFAINNRDLAAAECLLKAGANPNVISAVDGELRKPFGNGQTFGNFYRVSTPLFFAVMTDQLPLVQLLLRYHADPNNERTDGRSLLFSALDKPDILAALLDAGATVDARDTTKNENGRRQQSHWTPLLLAVRDNLSPGVVEMLLTHGANPNLPDDAFARTPLLWSVGWGDNRVPDHTSVELLLAHHADPNFRDPNGYTLLDYLKSMSKNATLADQTALASLCDLLRQHGALDHLPDWNHITVSRPEANFSRLPFTRDTNNWNQFTLLELLAVQCRILAATPASKGELDQKDAFFNPKNQSLPFPDLNHLRIHRPTADQKTNQEITVNLGASLQSGDCSNDVPLAWGDVVEIPETDHALKEDWEGFSDLELRNLTKCLTRHVSIIVKGQTKILTLAPDMSFKVESHGIPGLNQELQITTSIRSAVPYWLGPVLLKSGLVLTSSDLSRVQVTRHDPATGKTRTCTVDCSGISQNQFSDSDLWLRDGDIIEIPEKF